ncbi:MAG: helix-turn-helix domain-containing protein [Rhodospirillaceae bacterium]
MIAAPPLLRTADSAKYLNVSKSYLEKLRVSGNGPKYVRLGRLIRYRITDLDNFMDAKRCGSTSEGRRHG